MTLVVQPRLSATPGRAQVFIGDFGATKAQEPTFSLDGRPVAPDVLRPLSSARGVDDGVAPASGGARAFTGVYELRELEPGAQHELLVRVGEQARRISIGALPKEVPSAAEGGLDILLASCFCSAEHNPATLRSALAALVSRVRPKPALGRRPHCAFFMGDQVYLDLPTLSDFPDGRVALAEKFERDYVRNWEGGLAPLFDVAPSVCLPDDHEFWNNAPHSSPFIQNSWTEAGREAWRGAAQSAFEAFARPRPFAGKPGDTPFELTIHPLSFFLADGRSGRDEAAVLTKDCREALARWVTSLNDNGRIGVFVSGQSLFRAPQGAFGRRVEDREMPNYGDYSEIVANLLRAEHPLFALTGDVHWGRVTLARDATRTRLCEVVVSPLALVTTPGADQTHRLWGGIKGVFGQKEPWPRHSAPEAPPVQFGAGASRYACGSNANLTGDQLALLSFDYDSSRQRLRATVTYHFIHADPPPPVEVRLLDASILT